jgi:hypothetical protein
MEVPSGHAADGDAMARSGRVDATNNSNGKTRSRRAAPCLHRSRSPAVATEVGDCGYGVRIPAARSAVVAR